MRCRIERESFFGSVGCVFPVKDGAITADHIMLLHEQYLQTGSRQQVCANQPAYTGADNNDIVCGPGFAPERFKNPFQFRLIRGRGCFWRPISPVAFMSGDEFRTCNGRAHGNLAGKHCRCDNFGELQSATRAGTLEKFQTFTRSAEGGAAADRRNRERRECYARVEIAAVGYFEIRYADSGVDDIRNILTARDKQCGQTVCEVSVVTDRVRLQVADDRVVPHVTELIRRHVQIAFENRGGYKSPGSNFLAFAPGEQCAARPFLRAAAAENVIAADTQLLCNPAGRMLGRLYDHVHPLRITGRIAEMDHDSPADAVRLYSNQSAVHRRRFGLFPDGLEIRLYPVAEFVGIIGVVKEEHGRDAVFVNVNMCRNAASPRERDHSPLVRADERTFGGRKRHVEYSLRMVSIDQERTRNTDRNLRRPYRIFYVAAHLLGRNRMRSDVRQPASRSAFEPAAAFADMLRTVALSF
jgi:hypothetical protein